MNHLILWPPRYPPAEAESVGKMPVPQRMGGLLLPALIVQHFDAFSRGKPGSRWSPSFQ
jgi:hypothetical protein